MLNECDDCSSKKYLENIATIEPLSDHPRISRLTHKMYMSRRDRGVEDPTSTEGNVNLQYIS